jgi:hypothetical protein
MGGLGSLSHASFQEPHCKSIPTENILLTQIQWVLLFVMVMGLRRFRSWLLQRALTDAYFSMGHVDYGRFNWLASLLD